ncbi:SRPBCC domain-containing protein [Nocardioides halotolerans]|jgi:uncharacterized protein YndB with AHSA1/START domain|uniref:SRPBCC domain-containing protein n=1 Tax=Nocardioides halotolerans TaxID=433660 RepID=UPI0003FC9078|nr:SRPBCC domain-containing protein [Nocardioides halotolerans]
MYAQTASRLVRAPRATVYAALLDPRAIETWRVPDDMTARVAEWEPVEGGRFRVALTYRAEDRTGKTEGATDAYSGEFTSLVPDEQVVERVEFDTADAALRGAMTLTWRLTDAGGGTQVELLHEGIPDAVSPDDNAAGTDMSLTKLAAYVEGAG